MGNADQVNRTAVHFATGHGQIPDADGVEKPRDLWKDDSNESSEPMPVAEAVEHHCKAFKHPAAAVDWDIRCAAKPGQFPHPPALLADEGLGIGKYRQEVVD